MKIVTNTPEEVSVDSINCMDLNYEVYSTKTFFNKFNDEKNSLLNMASYDIKAVEKMLREARIEEEYTWDHVTQTQGYGNPDWFLGWQKDPHGKFRLQFGQLIAEDSKYSLQWKPLIECKSEVRLQAYEFLRFFIADFETVLREKLAINVSAF